MTTYVRITIAEDTRLAKLHAAISVWPLNNRQGLNVLISSLRSNYSNGRVTKAKFLLAINFLEQLILDKS